MRTRPADSSGFTLIEILLVVFIILIATAVSLPSFVRAYRGARLNSGARSLVMMHRLARGSAVLRQQSFALYIYQDLGKLELVSLEPESPVLSGDTEAMPVDPAGGFGDEESSVTSFNIEVESERLLPRDVSVVEVQLESEEQSEGGAFWINYYANGMCDPYTVVLADENGREATITVDHLSGHAEVVYE